MIIKKVFSIAILAMLFATACQPKLDAPQISVEDIWGRPSPKVASAGAFYMRIKNTGSQPDTLLWAGSPACGTAELHQSTMSEDGVMSMQIVEGGSVVIPPGETVKFEVGGLHVMCIDKQADFSLGDSYDLTLYFEKTGELNLQVEIKNP